MIIILTALGVGGATILGAAVGVMFKKVTKTFNDCVLAFAAGVMLAAAMLGLILPSLEYGGKYGAFTTVFGIFFGAACVHFMDKMIPVVTRVWGNEKIAADRVRKVFLFVMAIAIHNLPEGIAAGVGFGTSNVAGGILIATAIALQNIPEGLIVTVAMLGVNVKHSRAFLISAITGLIEIFGTFIGYFTVSLSSSLLPMVLAFAGGTMLYVISDEMIPETHSEENGKIATYCLLSGFSFMLIFNALI